MGHFHTRDSINCFAEFTKPLGASNCLRFLFHLNTREGFKCSRTVLCVIASSGRKVQRRKKDFHNSQLIVTFPEVLVVVSSSQCAVVLSSCMHPIRWQQDNNLNNDNNSDNQMTIPYWGFKDKREPPHGAPKSDARDNEKTGSNAISSDQKLIQKRSQAVYFSVSENWWHNHLSSEKAVKTNSPYYVM